MGFERRSRARGAIVTVREGVFAASQPDVGQYGVQDVGGITEGAFKDNNSKITVVTKDGTLNVPAATFDNLTDTPANKTGKALDIVRVNTGETALEYVSEGSDFLAQYALLAGRGSSQALIGGTTSGGGLTLESTSDVTKGDVSIASGSDLNIVNGQFQMGGTIILNAGRTVGLDWRPNEDLMRNLGNGTNRWGKLYCPKIIGDDAASGTLTLESSENATKGKILFGTSVYDEANNRLGIGTATPNSPMDVTGLPAGSVGGFTSGILHVTNSGAGAFDNSVITGHNLNGGNKQLWYLGSVSSSNDDIALINRQAGTLALYTSNAARLTVLTGGNVGIGTAAPTSLLHVAGDTKITGNLIVEGTTSTIESETLLVTDNHIFLNDGYTADPAQAGGIVVNFDPTTTADTVAAGGFTAGVAAVSNPTVVTVGSATFSASDIIQVSGSTGNDGLFEVLTHVGTTLTVRGIGTVGTVEEFSQNQFVTEAGVGSITKISVSVMHTGTDGVWETAFGSATGFVFDDVVGLAATQTLTNKTLTTPFISTVVGSSGAAGTLTLRATSNGTPGAVICEVEPGVEAWRTLSGGEFVLGRTTLFSTGDVAVFTKNTNSDTALSVENTISGTAAISSINARANSGVGEVIARLEATSAGFTASLGREPDAAILNSLSDTNGLIIMTGPATPIKFKTNAVVDDVNSERARILPAGGIVNGTGEGGTVLATGYILRAPDLSGGTDIAGADLTISAGEGRGIGDVGQIIFQTPRVQVTGSLAQTRATLMTLDEQLVTVTGNMSMSGDFDFTPTTANEGELGTDSLKWKRVRAATIVADDIELKGRDQDYTLFEAPEGLRLRNNKTKKTYRIKMEEIDAV